MPALCVNGTSTELFGCPDAGLLVFAEWYWHVHSYLSLVICGTGIITNVLNIIILSHKEMRTSVNCILTGIAVSDIITMASYIPYAIHFYLLTDLGPSAERYQYGWTIYLAIHALLTLYTHTVSIWLGVFLGILRYMFVTGRGNAQTLFTIRNTNIVICLFFLLSGICLIPNIMVTKIIPKYVNNETLWVLQSVGIGTDNQTALMRFAFWSYAVIGKILPVTLITIFGVLLLLTLRESKKRTQSLKGSSSENRLKQHDRTTRMLLAIIIVFIVTEAPQGVAVILAATVKHFMRNVYLLLADIFDMVALINNAINFWLYCTMNQQFRQHLVKIISAVFLRYKGYKRTSTNGNRKSSNTLTTSCL